MTRTWWFVKVFRGTNHWTTKCPQCRTGCSISISKNESSTSKICAYAAVLGIYLAVSGMVFTFTMQDPLQPAMSSIGFYAGIGGLALFLAGLVGALISDVANSKVVLTSVVICDQCGERLPIEFDRKDCPVCGNPLGDGGTDSGFFID
ncbi:MAG: hypothetical protein IID45_15015 [Planctomycetes bacterium]|nr:hypothetical protein [Planctomycetota bacterium]